MKELEKKIIINEDRILIYRISKGYAKPTYTVMEGFLENGDLKKTYSLSQWDDYGLDSWISDNDENINKLSFEFDINHPLYMPLFHLLNYDEELIIDDDETREENKKYLYIHKKEDKIFLDFIDNSNNIQFTEKFHVFIKNIGPDGRSKIDWYQKDTKKRLFVFFSEINKILINDYNQISIEEYLLKKSSKDEYVKLKKTFKRDYKHM